jgi:hypothetical protein
MNPLTREMKIAVFSLATSFLLLGCQPSAEAPVQIEMGTLEAVASQIAASTDEGLAATETRPAVVTPRPTASRQLTETPTPAYRITPGAPPPHLSFLTDRSSAPLASEGRAIGDYFAGNLFERPFTADDLEYRGYIDIAPGAELSLEPPWVYFTIYLEEVPPDRPDVVYAIEFDMEFDGRGDYLLLTTSPVPAEWSRDGVEMYIDTNDDVGGEVPMSHDLKPGNGYETRIFGENVGADPDAAWARLILSDESPGVQFALKGSILGSWRNFAWNAWADEGVKDPAMMDYNDHYSPEQAGSPVITDPNYPIGKLALIDNTCRSIVSYIPSGSVPGLCPLARPTATLGPTATSGATATP